MIAAMRLSLIGMAFPVVRRRASSSAHFQSVPGRSVPSFGKDENPESQFAELVQNVGFDQVLHSASVDSESMGTKEVLPRTGKQPVDSAFVMRSRTPDEAIVPTTEPLDVELLSRFDTVHPPKLCRKNDLALTRW